MIHLTLLSKFSKKIPRTQNTQCKACVNRSLKDIPKQLQLFSQSLWPVSWMQSFEEFMTWLTSWKEAGSLRKLKKEPINGKEIFLNSQINLITEATNNALLGISLFISNIYSYRLRKDYLVKMFIKFWHLKRITKSIHQQSEEEFMNVVKFSRFSGL